MVDELWVVFGSIAVNSVLCCKKMFSMNQVWFVFWVLISVKLFLYG